MHVTVWKRGKARNGAASLCYLPDVTHTYTHTPQLWPWQHICPLGISVKWGWPLGLGFTQGTIISTAFCHDHLNTRAAQTRPQKVNTFCLCAHKVTLFWWENMLSKHTCIHTTQTDTHTHTPVSKKQMMAGSSFFSVKNYMSFNVITGLTRTHSLCLLLCAGPPWERQTGACSEYLSNL